MLQNCTYEVDPLVYGKRQYDVRMREGDLVRYSKGKNTKTNNTANRHVNILDRKFRFAPTKVSGSMGYELCVHKINIG